MALLLALALASCLWRSDWLAQDRCLDGGGRWSQHAAACDHPAGSVRATTSP